MTGEREIVRGTKSPFNDWQTLKCHPEQFQAILRGEKRADFRSIADREFEVGEQINLREWDPGTERYTGDTCVVRVLHIEPGGSFGIPEGAVLLSLGLAAWRSEPPEGTRETLTHRSHCPVCHHRLDEPVNFIGGTLEPPIELGRA